MSGPDLYVLCNFYNKDGDIQIHKKLTTNILFFTLRVCGCKQTECKLMKPCIVGKDNPCGEHGICTPDRFCPYKKKMGKGIGMGYGMGMEENQDKLWPCYNGCCVCMPPSN